MLEVTGEKQGEILEITTMGTATKEDLATFHDALHQKTLQEEPLHILFVFKEIQGITLKALLEDTKTLPYIKSIHKGAIVADATFTQMDETISSLIPGVDVKHFVIGELDDARKWLERE